MRRRLLAPFLILAACSRATDHQRTTPLDRDEEEPAAVDVESARVDEAIVILEEEPAGQTPPKSERVVRVLEAADVHAAADAETAVLGKLASGTRVSVLAETTGPGCADAWLHVAPRGFVCARTQDTDRPASDTLLPVVPSGARVPGVYGRVRVDRAVIYPTLADAKARTNGHNSERALTVRRLSVSRVGDRSYWRTKHGWIEARDVVRFRGSAFEGTVLRTPQLDHGLSLPVAWTLANRERRTVAVRESASIRARELRRLAPHTALHVSETSEDGRWVRTDDGWIARADVSVAWPAEPPEMAGEGERWLDVDLDEQTLVAYEGTMAVYATLISSGRVRHRTPTGVFRISRKVAERTMNSMADSDEQYTVDKVPWTFYFDTGYALHAAFWHDGFGRPRSHGCVNLSPRDAQRLYGWTAPAVAPGWSEVYGHSEQPGSVVRIRSRRDPDPRPQGYALALRDTSVNASG
jgi:hypothetical protein